MFLEEESVTCTEVLIGPFPCALVVVGCLYTCAQCLGGSCRINSPGLVTPGGEFVATM